MVIRIVVAMLVAAALLAVASPVAATLASDAGQAWITKKQYGKRWPFKVRAGLLRCEGSAVTFRARGVTYAVNGTARGLGQYADINRIWRFDPAYPGLGLRVNIGPIIDRGLTLC